MKVTRTFSCKDSFWGLLPRVTAQVCMPWHTSVRIVHAQFLVFCQVKQKADMHHPVSNWVKSMVFLPSSFIILQTVFCLQIHCILFTHTCTHLCECIYIYDLSSSSYKYLFCLRARLDQIKFLCHLNNLLAIKTKFNSLRELSHLNHVRF